MPVLKNLLGGLTGILLAAGVLKSIELSTGHSLDGALWRLFR